MIERFQHFIRHMDVDLYTKGESPSELLLTRSGSISVDYAPFDYVAQNAKLVVMGLTPGRTQAANALRSLQSQLRRDVPMAEALRVAKSAASFSGTMRNSLVAMLDHIGVAERFGRHSTSEFFTDGEDDVHFTSCLRYPVYVDGRNYSGSPNLAKYPKIASRFEKLLDEEANQLSDALWIPLGKYAEGEANRLADRGIIKKNRVFSGLPHPSGANAERIAYFLEKKPKERLSSKTNAAKIDEARQQLRSKVTSL